MWYSTVTITRLADTIGFVSVVLVLSTSIVNISPQILVRLTTCHVQNSGLKVSSCLEAVAGRYQVRPPRLTVGPDLQIHTRTT